MISPWPRLFISYIDQCVCTFLRTQSCTLWLSCYNTSLPAEAEVFLPLRIPPAARSPALLSACCYLWDWLGSRDSPVAWQHRTRWGGRKGKLGQGRRCHPLLVVLRSARAKAVRHVASPKVSLSPSHGWLIDEPFTLPHNTGDRSLKTWEMQRDDNEIWRHGIGSSSGKKLSQFLLKIPAFFTVSTCIP